MEHLRNCPEVVYEQLDPMPMEEAIIPPRPARMSDLVRQYVRSQLAPQVPDEEDPNDFEDFDEQDAVLTDHQALAEALEYEREETSFLHAEQSEVDQTPDPSTPVAPEDPSPEPEGAEPGAGGASTPT